MKLPEKAGEGVAPGFERQVGVTNGRLLLAEETQELAGNRLRLVQASALKFLRKFLKKPIGKEI